MANTLSFIERVLSIKDPAEARTFFESSLSQSLHDDPAGQDHEKALRAAIGYCFGAGMKITYRQMWHDVCGAVHPIMPELTNRDPSPEEMFQRGGEWAESRMRGTDLDSQPTAWARLLGDD